MRQALASLVTLSSLGLFGAGAAQAQEAAATTEPATTVAPTAEPAPPTMTPAEPPSEPPQPEPALPMQPVPPADTSITPPPPPPPVSRAPTGGPQLEGPRDGVPDCRVGAAACIKNDMFALWPRLRLRNGFDLVQPDSQLLTVGQNDGFFLDQNRIGVDGAFKDDLRFRLIIDVVNLVPGVAPNSPVAPISAAVRDAWVAWMPSDWFFLSAGQQFMPADLEGTSTISVLPFARRSVATQGVRAGLGFAVDGLSPARQPSIVFGSTENAKLGSIALQYLVGVGNGNGQNILGNDNKLPATYARFGVGYVDGDTQLRIGLGGRFNPRTVGTLPNLFTETESVGFVDLDVRVAGVNLAAQAMYKDVSFGNLTPFTAPNDSGLGATAWLTADRPFGVDLFGLRPAYRFSYFDPSASFADDQLIENTLAVRWDVPVDGMPLSVIVDGTLLTEFGEGVRDLDNARATAMVQLEL